MAFSQCFLEREYDKLSVWETKNIYEEVNDIMTITNGSLDDVNLIIIGVGIM